MVLHLYCSSWYCSGETKNKQQQQQKSKKHKTKVRMWLQNLNHNTLIFNTTLMNGSISQLLKLHFLFAVNFTVMHILLCWVWSVNRVSKPWHEKITVFGFQSGVGGRMLQFTMATEILLLLFTELDLLLQSCNEFEHICQPKVRRLLWWKMDSWRGRHCRTIECVF